MASGQDIMKMLMDRGLSPVHAAAIVGHGTQESGWNTSALNKGEGAYGAIQWRLDRRDNLNKFAESRGVGPNDLPTQLDFILHEMGGSEKKAGDQFFAAKELPDVHAALKKYIRYGDNSDAVRLGHANALLGGNAVPIAAQGAVPVSGAPVPLGGAAVPAAVNPAGTPVGAVPGQPGQAVTPVTTALAKMAQEEPLTPDKIQMAQPMGLDRVKQLLAAMNRSMGSAT